MYSEPNTTDIVEELLIGVQNLDWRRGETDDEADVSLFIDEPYVRIGRENGLEILF